MYQGCRTAEILPQKQRLCQHYPVPVFWQSFHGSGSWGLMQFSPGHIRPCTSFHSCHWQVSRLPVPAPRCYAECTACLPETWGHRLVMTGIEASFYCYCSTHRFLYYLPSVAVCRNVVIPLRAGGAGELELGRWHIVDTSGLRWTGGSACHCRFGYTTVVRELQAVQGSKAAV